MTDAEVAKPTAVRQRLQTHLVEGRLDACTFTQVLAGGIAREFGNRQCAGMRKQIARAFAFGIDCFEFCSRVGGRKGATA